MQISIIGSLGNISKPLSIELVQKGHQVTIISSNGERRKDIEAMGYIAAKAKFAMDTNYQRRTI